MSAYLQIAAVVLLVCASWTAHASESEQTAHNILPEIHEYREYVYLTKAEWREVEVIAERNYHLEAALDASQRLNQELTRQRDQARLDAEQESREHERTLDLAGQMTDIANNQQHVLDALRQQRRLVIGGTSVVVAGVVVFAVWRVAQ